MQKRFAIFLILSATIFIGWQFMIEKYFLPASPVAPKNQQSSVNHSPSPSIPATLTTQQMGQTIPPPTLIEARQIKLKTPLWEASLSNQGGVLTEWTMTHFIDGTAIDENKGGVHLISPTISKEIGAPLRFFIAYDQQLEKELNSAWYQVENTSDPEIKLEKGEQREVSFVYSNNGVIARKRLIFNGNGYDFDFQTEVTRNGQPVEVAVVIGPNFGDQSIKHYGYYSPAPQVSFAVDGKVKREAASAVKATEPHRIQGSSITWASVDDNYFGMAFVPMPPVSVINVLNFKRRENFGSKEEDHNYISVAILVSNGQINHIYSGPKDPTTLALISQKFGLKNESSNLEDLINYGFLSSIVKPLAQVMLSALKITYRFTHNYGWSIVILTIVLNMFFFPLRWKSSISMKRTAAMQPRMKDLQERMRKLDKNDPRMAELQREQVALMREGNPLMGCLPLLLQLPFFYAVFTILTVSIEVRHAPFLGWIQDLSSPDQYWILPIVMCISMLVQQALTPSTADPVQKKVGYLMPLLFTGMFFIYAPAGLVLYWMVGNLVGIAQQFIINKMSPPNTPVVTDSSRSDKGKGPITKGKKAKELVANP